MNLFAAIIYPIPESDVSSTSAVNTEQPIKNVVATRGYYGDI